MSNFKDKVAVITGGASGVGYAIGAALAKEGAEVVLSDIESSALESAKANLEKEGLSVFIKQADVSNHDSMVALNKFVTAEVGDVQMLLITLVLHLQNYNPFGIQIQMIGIGLMGLMLWVLFMVCRLSYLIC